MRIRRPITVAERSTLDAMRDEVLVRLRGDGLSVGWLVHRTGVPASQCRQWLAQFGGYWNTKGISIYRIASQQRKDNCER